MNSSISITAPDTQERINQYWSTYAKEYEAHQHRRMQEPGELQAWERVWSAVLPKPPAKVLDLGTGTGHAALVVAGLGHDVTGVDLSAGMLAEARRKARLVDNPPRFLEADATSPPFNSGEFDALTARFVLWTIRKPAEVLRRWYDLLHPGGKLVVVDGLWFPDGLLASPHAATIDNQRGRDFRDAYSDAVADLKLAESAEISPFAQAIEAAGFTKVRVDELPEIMELDRRNGVAPNHAVQMCYRISATRPKD